LTPETERARAILEEALEAARADHNPGLSAVILCDLGNALASEQHYTDALKAYDESSTLARQTSNSLQAAQALCNAAVSAVRAGEPEKANEFNAQGIRESERLPASHDKAFLLLTAGQTDCQIQFTNTEASHQVTLRAYDSFQKALDIAHDRNDPAIETYALG